MSVSEGQWLSASVLRIGMAIFGGLGCTLAMGQAFPSKPIVAVLPAGPGTALELEGRVHFAKMAESLGQPVLIDFKPGGASMIAMNHVAKSPADGYTLLLMSSSISMVPLLEIELPFDGLNAFAPVSLISRRWGVLAVHPSIPVNNVAEFVAYAKAHPGTLNFGTSSAGKLVHLTGAWLQSLTGVDMTYVHYKSGSASQADLVAGRVNVTTMTMVGALPLMKAGKIRVLGTANLTRNPAFPDMPTLNEQGLKDFEYKNWLGLSAPAKTPAAIVNRISAEVAKAVKSPDVVKKMAAETYLEGSTPEEFRRVISAETENWRKLVKAQNIKLEMD